MNCLDERPGDSKQGIQMERRVCMCKGPRDLKIIKEIQENKLA